MNTNQKILLTEIESLIIQDNPNATQNLKDYIRNTYENFNTSENITDWQKIKIAGAIAAYKINWLYLSKCSLILAYEDPKNISQEPWHIAHCKEAADHINLADLIDDI